MHLPPSTLLVAFLLVCAGCPSASHGPPLEGQSGDATARPEDPPAAGACPARLLREHLVDVGQAPEICEALSAAIAFLGPAARAEVRGLRIVRGSRGPCGDACPDLATTLMSEAALAFYRVQTHELHVLDAMFDAPRWRAPPPDFDAVRVYLATLGIGWDELVTRVRAVTGAELAGEVPLGDVRVFEAVVAHGPRILLEGDISRGGILLHELGHALLLRADGDAARTRVWASLSDWRVLGQSGYHDRADGYFGGELKGELPLVASRLALGLGRGAGTLYRPSAGEGATLTGFPTRYAAFDPREDYAESLRLLRDDPVRLGQVAPAKLLFMLAVVAAGRPASEIEELLRPHRAFVAAGLEGLSRHPEARQMVEAVLGPALVGP